MIAGIVLMWVLGACGLLVESSTQGPVEPVDMLVAALWPVCSVLFVLFFVRKTILEWIYGKQDA